MADQYTGTVQLFFTTGIAIYFIYLSKKLLCKQKFDMNNAKKSRRVLETLLVVSSVVAPALYVWVPFRAVPYGENGPWCWIRSLKGDCSRIKESFWEKMGIWYIPFGIAAFFSFFAITLFLVGLCRSMSQFKKRKGQKKGEACLLIAFLCTYCLLFVVEIVCQSIADLVKVDHFTVWMLYALSTPLSGVMLPIGLLIYTYTGTLREVAKEYCKCHCIRRRTLFITLFRDPSSFTSAQTPDRSSDFIRLSDRPAVEDVPVHLPMPHERTGLLSQLTD